MKSKTFCILLILRIILGMVFIFSAVTKLLTIDSFEVYIFSFGFVPLNTSFILARVCIAGEIMLGVGLVSNLCGRLVNLATQVVLILFCVFLCYAALIGREDSCQCFGSLLNINPIQSLLKNAILIIWALVISKVPSFQWHPHWYLWVAFMASCLALPFLISPPDHWIYNNNDKDIPYNKELLTEQLAANIVFIENGGLNGNKIVAFVSPYCPYCQMSVEKLQTIQQRHNLPDSSFIYVIPQLKQPAETDYSPIIISRELFTRITYGQFPVIVFVRNCIPDQSFHYRSINEYVFYDFLSATD